MKLDSFAKWVGGSIVAVWLVGNLTSIFVPSVAVPHGLNVAAMAVVAALFGGATLSGKGRSNGASDANGSRRGNPDE